MDIITRLLELRRREHLCSVDLIEALAECDRTRAYLDHAYESMWKFLTDALRYSNGAASRRYRVLKCARKFPVVIEWLRAERVTLCSLEAIAPLLDGLEDEQALLDRIEGKSHAEVQRVVAQARPASERREVVQREFVQSRVAVPTALFEVESGESESGSPSAQVAPLVEPVSPESPELPAESSPLAWTPTPPRLPHAEERVRVTLSLTPEEFAWLERARMLASRRPGRVPSVHDMVVESARFYVERKAPKAWKKQAAKDEPTKPKADVANNEDTATADQPNTTRSRHIPVAIRDAVFLRDGERCTFVGPDGKRCQATHDLQIDHIERFSRGGAHDPENLRVLCGAHNRRREQRSFGEPSARGVPLWNSRPSSRE